MIWNRFCSLILHLAEERALSVTIPPGWTERFGLFRALCNTRPPMPADGAFLSVQDAFLQETIAARGIADALIPIRENICLWKGDITALKADAIVNAANSGMLGCFCPNHGCVDNAIHTFAGVQLRPGMRGADESAGRPPSPPGRLKSRRLTTLPARCVLHNRRAHGGRLCYRKGRGAACRLLPLLHGARGGKRLE